jgi:hypothetical protein
LLSRQEADDAGEGHVLGGELLEEEHEATGRESMSLRDDDDAR